MNPRPSAQLFTTATGSDLVFTRTFRAPVEDVWASVTEPERTARWFGPWRGEGTPGSTIEVQMAFEDTPTWCDMRIDACDPPNKLAVSMIDDAGVWRLELLLNEAGGVTELRMIQHLETTDGVGQIGPGWEYYLDMLVAARDGAELPDFGAYYPAMKSYFEELASAPSIGDGGR
jgi:uncharacterized protein YndB with AHSA1/START domain